MQPMLIKITEVHPDGKAFISYLKAFLSDQRTPEDLVNIIRKQAIKDGKEVEPTLIGE